MLLKRSFVTLAIAVAAYSSPISGQELSLPKQTQKWIEIRTAHFRFFSNAGRMATRQVAVDLEELRAVLAELTDYDLLAPIPTFIFVFKGDRSFLPYKLLYENRPAAVSGYFIGGDHANFIAINADAQDASAIVYHEYVHYVANNNMWYLPMWFSEGLAEFYESFEVVGDTVYIGLPLLRHLAVLKGAVPIPLDQLLAVGRNSDLYNESDRKGMFYSQSWALVHYLLLGDEERRQQLGDYLDLVRNGVPGDEAFTTAFSGDYESLTRELRGYLRTLRFPSIETKADFDLDKEFEIRKMSYAEVLYRLGELLANQQPERPERSVYFETAIAVDPEYGAPISAMAIEAEEKANWRAALTLHERAAKFSPDDAMVLFRWGDFLSRRGGQLKTAVAVLTRSTELDPSFAPAWATLAKVYADAGETSEVAVEAAHRAHLMRPSDTMATRDLVRLYLRLDRREEAVSLIEDALRSDPRAQAEAWTLVIHRDLERSRDLLRDDLPLEATERLSLAEPLVARSLYPQVVRQNIDWTRRSIDEQMALAHYERAQQLFSRDDREAAREELELSLEIIDDGPVAFSSRQLLDLIDHPDQPSASGVVTFNPSPTKQEIDHLNKLIVEKEFEAALEFLEAMRLRVGVEQREWLADRIRDIRRTVDYNSYVDNYNRAVDFYNKRQYEDAVRVLEALLATLTEDRESDSVKALLDDALEALDSP
jgi:tetratricopeptide (TPR) repeat protein